ncbi:hypothetical protein MPTK1_4g17280 [Marchantia polymorpha subsp. ruderalis]|uniref:Uncharacterized protein n=2 Tax=Marchantia polymorpha TaxID=3197 RepID=A0AAF6BAT5_MARPO|nr:hypothetical protein MARPO_0041s0010 [Marchantia polymorpha]BBN09119.1 hypothetical protein Mp_4g17280 [Marchantia polymorpha subsp. ruderalis]|eukprot:PTQ40107.1 hypothetical protein MARPO_0041s0010 [Marchantia polymorpha]
MHKGSSLCPHRDGTIPSHGGEGGTTSRQKGQKEPRPASVIPSHSITQAKFPTNPDASQLQSSADQPRSSKSQFVLPSPPSPRSPSTASLRPALRFQTRPPRARAGTDECLDAGGSRGSRSLRQSNEQDRRRCEQAGDRF